MLYNATGRPVGTCNGINLSAIPNKTKNAPDNITATTGLNVATPATISKEPDSCKADGKYFISRFYSLQPADLLFW